MENNYCSDLFIHNIKVRNKEVFRRSIVAKQLKYE